MSEELCVTGAALARAPLDAGLVQSAEELLFGPKAPGAKRVSPCVVLSPRTSPSDPLTVHVRYSSLARLFQTGASARKWVSRDNALWLSSGDAYRLPLHGNRCFLSLGCVVRYSLFAWPRADKAAQAKVEALSDLLKPHPRSALTPPSVLKASEAFEDGTEEALKIAQAMDVPSLKRFLELLRELLEAKEEEEEEEGQKRKARAGFVKIVVKTNGSASDSEEATEEEEGTDEDWGQEEEEEEVSNKSIAREFESV